MERIDSYNYKWFGGKRQFSDGPPGTVIDAAWLNAVQEEICAVIEDVGITLNQADSNQLLAAIRSFAITEFAAPWYDVTDYGAERLTSASGGAGVDSAIGFVRTINNFFRGSTVSFVNSGTGLIIIPPGIYNLLSTWYITDINRTPALSLMRLQIEGYGSRLRMRTGSTYPVKILGSGELGSDLFTIDSAYSNIQPIHLSQNNVPIQIGATKACVATFDCDSTDMVVLAHPMYYQTDTNHQDIAQIRNLVFDVPYPFSSNGAVIGLGSQDIYMDGLFNEASVYYDDALWYSTLWNVYAVASSGSAEYILSRRNQSSWRSWMIVSKAFSTSKVSTYRREVSDIGY